ncbi:Nramp family divalent metal transporter [Demetria terragena]|uniref:Nramp family divalent metal transporter n=1 Tax=Demetria terragena TaxID=63959 RepID=UPI0003A9D565|nr:Nramp family divalent metal transporter [Demetria terragena]
MSSSTPAGRATIAPPGRGEPEARRSRGLLAIGPAFVAAVAYVDPGNIATNTAAGATYGFLLLWVVVLATLMAGPVQYLSAKLGLVTGKSLPAYVAGRVSRRARIAYWMQAEAVAIATDIAEIIGAALAMHLLFGMPLVPAGLIAGAIGMLLLAARDRLGRRFLESMCLVSLFVIGAGFVVGVLTSPPGLDDLAGGLVPALGGAETVLLAAGIVGATVMPHAVYLHSSLTAERPVDRGHLMQRLRWTRMDVGTAMILAGGINVSMLVLGATALRGVPDDSFGAAAAALTERVGDGAGTAFLVALLVSGVSSTAVGTHAGAAIMAGLLHRQVSPLVRRAVTLVPALVLLASGLEPVTVLVLSQVALALGLPFALIPLLRATCDAKLMGPWRNHRALTAVAVAIVAIVVVIDLVLVGLVVTGRG